MRAHRIAIVEPAAVVAEGIESILSRSYEANAVLRCASVAELVSRMRGAEIELIIVAATLIEQVISHNELRDIPFIALQSTLCPNETLRKAASVVTLYSTPDEIIAALHEAIEAPTNKSHTDSHELSERERDVLVLVAKGHTNKEIASELNISPHTVISHRKNIVHKTGIRSVAGLTVYAVLNRLIESE